VRFGEFHHGGPGVLSFRDSTTRYDTEVMQIIRMPCLSTQHRFHFETRDQVAEETLTNKKLARAGSVTNHVQLVFVFVYRSFLSTQGKKAVLLEAA
jgi:hypothetical protein